MRRSYFLSRFKKRLDIFRRLFDLRRLFVIRGLLREEEHDDQKEGDQDHHGDLEDVPVVHLDTSGVLGTFNL